MKRPDLRLGFLAFLIGTAFGGVASANEAAVNAAYAACDQQDFPNQEQKNTCVMHALAMHHSVQAAAEGSEGAIHYDFDDSNDSAAVASAKQAFNAALEACEDAGSGGGEMESCRLDAFHQYHEAIGN